LGDFGGDSRATRTNASGYVVGDATTPSDRSHGFLFDPATGRMADLNSLVAAGGLTIRHAAAIGDDGRIVGEATDAAGNRHVVLLLPRDPMPAIRAAGSLGKDGTLTINGSTGNDQITVGPGAEQPLAVAVSINGAVTQFAGSAVHILRINGGPGDDRIDVRDGVGAGTLYVDGHTGNDRIGVGDTNMNATVHGGTGDDLVRGSATGSSRLYGDAGNDTLVGGDATDVLFGGEGDDSLAGGNAVNEGVNRLFGEGGNDTIVGGRGRDIVDAGAGNDSVVTAAGTDTIDSGDGDDDVDAGAGDDVVNGGGGDDFLRGGEGSDYLYGDRGDDTVWGQSGDDVLGGDAGFTGELVALPTPQPGDDSLDGGTGNDYLVGSRESITFADDNGTDTMTGGPGGDVINARGDDVATDAGPDDVVPAERTAGSGPFAVQQTATLSISLPPAAGGVGTPTPLPNGTGKFAGSAFYAEADGTLHMQDTVAREFTLGEFFRNWGVPATFGKTGRFGRFTQASITVNGVQNPPLDRWVVQAGDVIMVVVSV
jgi:probable HAF family extracellular repeat protein